MFCRLYTQCIFDLWCFRLTIGLSECDLYYNSRSIQNGLDDMTLEGRRVFVHNYLSSAWNRASKSLPFLFPKVLTLPQTPVNTIQSQVGTQLGLIVLIWLDHCWTHFAVEFLTCLLFIMCFGAATLALPNNGFPFFNPSFPCPNQIPSTRSPSSEGNGGW